MIVDDIINLQKKGEDAQSHEYFPLNCILNDYSNQ